LRGVGAFEVVGGALEVHEVVRQEVVKQAAQILGVPVAHVHAAHDHGVDAARLAGEGVLRHHLPLVGWEQHLQQQDEHRVPRRTQVRRVLQQVGGRPRRVHHGAPWMGRGRGRGGACGGRAGVGMTPGHRSIRANARRPVIAGVSMSRGHCPRGGHRVSTVSTGWPLHETPVRVRGPRRDASCSTGSGACVRRPTAPSARRCSPLRVASSPWRHTGWAAPMRSPTSSPRSSRPAKARGDWVLSPPPASAHHRRDGSAPARRHPGHLRRRRIV
jgi:hypothetical protein